MADLRAKAAVIHWVCIQMRDLLTFERQWVQGHAQVLLKALHMRASIDQPLPISTQSSSHLPAAWFVCNTVGSTLPVAGSPGGAETSISCCLRGGSILRRRW